MTDDSPPEDKGSHRKERVLHTRVPAVLEQELKRLARALRVPVSNVVRTALEDAVQTVDAVGERAEGELRSVADRLSEKRTQLRQTRRPVEAPLAAVVGYQEVTLARDATCALSGKSLAVGDTAHLGFRDDGGPPVVIAPECLPRSAAGAEKPEKGDNDGTDE